MNKETIIKDIREGVSAGILSVDDVLVELNKRCEERLRSAVIDSGGRIVFSEYCPRIVSCCFSEVKELNVKEILFEDGLRFLCEEPETQDRYRLDADDFLLGELRHIVDQIA